MSIYCSTNSYVIANLPSQLESEVLQVLFFMTYNLNPARNFTYQCLQSLYGKTYTDMNPNRISIMSPLSCLGDQVDHLVAARLVTLEDIDTLLAKLTEHRKTMAIQAGVVPLKHAKPTDLKDLLMQVLNIGTTIKYDFDFTQNTKELDSFAGFLEANVMVMKTIDFRFAKEFAISVGQGKDMYKFTLKDGIIRGFTQGGHIVIELKDTRQRLQSMPAEVRYGIILLSVANLAPQYFEIREVSTLR